MPQPINLALCKVIAPPVKQLPDLVCACCGKPLKQQAGENTVLLYATVVCNGKQYRVCRDCGKVIMWATERWREHELHDRKVYAGRIG